MELAILYAGLLLRFEEGKRNKPYYDDQGYPTIGFGHLLSPIAHSPLPDLVWTDAQCEEDLTCTIYIYVKDLTNSQVTKPVWNALQGDSSRQAILISMCYQLGIARLGGFKNTLAAILQGNYSKAAAEMMDSDVGRKYPDRWNRQAAVMKSGDIKTSYKI